MAEYDAAVWWLLVCRHDERRWGLLPPELARIIAAFCIKRKLVGVPIGRSSLSYLSDYDLDIRLTANPIITFNF